MKKKSSVKFTFSLLLLLNLTLISGCSSRGSTSNTSFKSNIDLSNAPLDVTVLEIGKSDCIIIQIDDKTVMIDTGLDDNGNQIVSFLNEKHIDQIDYLIISHLDKDHIGGADKILDAVSVSEVIQSNYERDTKQYKQYSKALSKYDLNPIYPTETLVITIGDAVLTIYPPLQQEYEQSNDYSLITSLVYGDQSFLFAGDAESTRLSEFLTTHPQHYTLLKLPHHGRDSEQLDPLLTAITPAYGIITCSEEEQPDASVIELLAKHNIQTLLSSDGPITIKTDGTNLSVTQQLKTIISFNTID